MAEESPPQINDMNPNTFAWKSGLVDFWDLDAINEKRPLRDQVDHLKEDLAQIRFPGGIVLDLGWYPSFDPHGMFKIMIVQGDDWENPLFLADAKDIPSLREQISLAILSAV